MLDRQKNEALFLEHLDWIEKVAARLCRHKGVPESDAEDFAAWIKIELIKDDYAVIGNYRGESLLRTYLTTVITRRFHDYWRGRLGRWRPSAMAARMGPPAPELEALVHRDGYTLSQAAEKLRTGGRTTLSDAQLARLLASLPARPPMRVVEVTSDVALDVAPDRSGADGGLAAAEAGERRDEINEALRRAMDRLEPEDQMIVRMHLVDGYTLADVARALRLEQKPLYRRVERLLKQLREYLENGGVRGEDVRDMLGDEEDR
ncbi:MAG TPA: sigma-70 family RNA polymerase sigma factor [Longimicrobiaceae bacterium]|jgi:RNA polymerase sigma factor for flagellar operon FliA|nr:sigma-70 family RNA polymerase sigma factor [Longimicrobiaceae bacterium]